MEFSGKNGFIPRSSSTELIIEQEFIINKTLFTHESNRRVDCKILFQAMENVIFYASNSNKAIDVHPLDTIENFASKEILEHAIYKMSRAVLYECHNTTDMHMKTIVLLELLGNYRWDAKVVLILTSFAIIYGEFRLVLDVYAHNSLAASLATLKNLYWKDFEALRPQFKAMEMLIKDMMELAKCVVRFEGLPYQFILYNDLGYTLMASTKSQIYLATYWIVRSALTTVSQITNLITIKQENLNITANAAWGLSSLALKLSTICSCLKGQVDSSQEHIEKKLFKRLTDIVKDDTQIDNQEMFHLFFSLDDELPLIDSSSQVKIGISKLKHKVVMILVSKPDLQPIHQILLLLQQTHEQPHHKNIDQDYEIVWVPISSSETWTLEEHISFDYLSNSLPWLSVRQPWLLNPSAVRMIREEWKFEDKPLLVALDSQGLVSNYSAFNMVLIWGEKAYPFSNLREKELWEEEHWNVKLMLNGIDRFLMETVGGGQNICICGSSNAEWIQEFESRIKKLQNVGLQLQVIYVGSRTDTSENMLTTLAVMNKDISFTPTKIRFFWLRLERIKDSLIRVGKIQKFANYETFLQQVSELLETNDHNTNWAVFGCGDSKNYVKLKGNEIMEFFDQFPVWAKKVATSGFMGAIKSGDDEVNDDVTCDHSTMVPYVEGMIQGNVVCDKCKRVLSPYVVYQCDGAV